VRNPKYFPLLTAGLLYGRDPGVPAGLIPTQKNAFAPRVGLALDPSGSGKLPGQRPLRHFSIEPYYTGQGGPLQDPISGRPISKLRR